MTEGDLAFEVGEAVSRLARRLRQERPAHELGPTALSALTRLYRDGPASSSALAAAENVQPQSMTRVVATLVDRRLVERRSHPSDGRQTLLTITAAGRDLVDQDHDQRNAWLTGVIEERLTPVEGEFLRAAAKLLDLLAR